MITSLSRPCSWRAPHSRQNGLVDLMGDRGAGQPHVPGPVVLHRHQLMALGSPLGHRSSRSRIAHSCDRARPDGRTPAIRGRSSENTCLPDFRPDVGTRNAHGSDPGVTTPQVRREVGSMGRRCCGTISSRNTRAPMPATCLPAAGSVARSAPAAQVTALVAPEQRKNVESRAEKLAFLEFHGIFPESLIRSCAWGRRSGAAMIGDFGAKLRITAAALGCARRKICARAFVR